MSKSASLKKSVSNNVKVSELPSFDTAEFLKTDEDIALYISLVIEEGDAGELAHALGIAARARGMSDIADASGLTREALYKALRPGSAPRFDTVNRVCAALGVRLVAQPVGS
jgi:probable addiction module antidote protein